MELHNSISLATESPNGLPYFSDILKSFLSGKGFSLRSIMPSIVYYVTVELLGCFTLTNITVYSLPQSP